MANTPKDKRCQARTHAKREPFDTVTHECGRLDGHVGVHHCSHCSYEWNRAEHTL